MKKVTSIVVLMIVFVFADVGSAEPGSPDMVLAAAKAAVADAQAAGINCPDILKVAIKKLEKAEAQFAAKEYDACELTCVDVIRLAEITKACNSPISKVKGSFEAEPRKPAGSKWNEYGPGFNPDHMYGRAIGYYKYALTGETNESSVPKSLEVTACLSSELRDVVADPNTVSLSSNITLSVNDVEIATTQIIADDGKGEVYNWEVTSPDLISKIGIHNGTNSVTFEVKKSAEHKNGIVVWFRTPITLSVRY